MCDDDGFVALVFHEREPAEMQERGEEYLELMAGRRTTRHFSDRPVDRQLIELAVETAGTAPSGAHLQPWTFVAISDPELKANIRAAAEAQEQENYSGRMPETWLEVLRPLGTDEVKEHITDAPWLVVLFKQTKREQASGELAPTYYATESVGIAAGMFIAAIHNMGLCTLTHTPSPMGFLRDILGRPEHETPLLLMPVGYPAREAKVPDIERKSLSEISEWFEAQDS